MCCQIFQQLHPVIQVGAQGPRSILGLRFTGALLEFQCAVPDAFANQESYTTIDLRATWMSPIENLEVKAFINNATDELYKVSQNAFSGGRIMADYGRQRLWGIRIGYGF